MGDVVGPRVAVEVPEAVLRSWIIEPARSRRLDRGDRWFVRPLVVPLFDDRHRLPPCDCRLTHPIIVGGCGTELESKFPGPELFGSDPFGLHQPDQATSAAAGA